jgi:hypothetical protein
MIDKLSVHARLMWMNPTHPGWIITSFDSVEARKGNLVLVHHSGPALPLQVQHTAGAAAATAAEDIGVSHPSAAATAAALAAGTQGMYIHPPEGEAHVDTDAGGSGSAMATTEGGSSAGSLTPSKRKRSEHGFGAGAGSQMEHFPGWSQNAAAALSGHGLSDSLLAMEHLKALTGTLLASTQQQVLQQQAQQMVTTPPPSPSHSPHAGSAVVLPYSLTQMAHQQQAVAEAPQQAQQAIQPQLQPQQEVQAVAAEAAVEEHPAEAGMAGEAAEERRLGGGIGEVHGRKVNRSPRRRRSSERR